MKLLSGARIYLAIFSPVKILSKVKSQWIIWKNASLLFQDPCWVLWLTLKYEYGDVEFEVLLQWHLGILTIIFLLWHLNPLFVTALCVILHMCRRGLDSETLNQETLIYIECRTAYMYIYASDNKIMAFTACVWNCTPPLLASSLKSPLNFAAQCRSQGTQLYGSSADVWRD